MRSIVSINYLYDVFQETLKELFPTWEAVSKRYREVVLFVAGLMEDPRPLVQHVYEMQMEYYLNELRISGYLSIDTDLLKALRAESSVRLVDHPLHNKYINYYNDVSDPDTTPVYCPSRLYHFEWMMHGVALENYLTGSTEIPSCAMFIDSSPDEAVTNTLLSTCSQISRNQAVTDLWMSNAFCRDATEAEVPILGRNIQLLCVHSCHLSRTFLRNVFQQLHDCIRLTYLGLKNIDLREVEEDLDKLLDNLVSHHKKGLSKEKLRIRIKQHSLSEEFVAKWRRRCEGSTSIDYRIRLD